MCELSSRIFVDSGKGQNKRKDYTGNEITARLTLDVRDGAPPKES